jgi:hypothetical protein
MAVGGAFAHCVWTTASNSDKVSRGGGALWLARYALGCENLALSCIARSCRVLAQASRLPPCPTLANPQIPGDMSHCCYRRTVVQFLFTRHGFTQPTLTARFLNMAMLNRPSPQHYAAASTNGSVDPCNACPHSWPRAWKPIANA